MRFVLAISAALTLGTTVLAEGVKGFTPAATEQCLASMSENQWPNTCIGHSATVCMETTEGGWSSIGMSRCWEQELNYWDARLNAAYKDVRAKRKRSDAIETQAPSQVEALKQMQRAWITYRDAKCAYERSHWFGGTGGGPAAISCLMYETANQALYLEADAQVE